MPQTVYAPAAGPAIDDGHALIVVLLFALVVLCALGALRCFDRWRAGRMASEEPKDRP